METNKRFDCLEMKNTIQQKMYAETKDMTQKELLMYFNGNKTTEKKAVKKSKN